MQTIGSIFIGDWPNTSASYEWIGHLTQFVIFRTKLASHNTAGIEYVYNHGRWRNMWSHWYRSSLVAWWQLGEESAVDALDFPSTNPITSTYDPPSAGETAINTISKVQIREGTYGMSFWNTLFV